LGFRRGIGPAQLESKLLGGANVSSFAASHSRAPTGSRRSLPSAGQRPDPVGAPMASKLREAKANLPPRTRGQRRRAADPPPGFRVRRGACHRPAKGRTRWRPPEDAERLCAPCLAGRRRSFASDYCLLTQLPPSHSDFTTASACGHEASL
jgi:hypothetical protein